MNFIFLQKYRTRLISAVGLLIAGTALASAAYRYQPASEANTVPETSAAAEADVPEPVQESLPAETESETLPEAPWEPSPR